MAESTAFLEEFREDERATLAPLRFAVCVGRLIPSKRVDAAIAWAHERRQFLVVVGDGPERTALERGAQRCGARVFFAGRTSRREALAWIAASSQVVHASRAEGAK